MQRLTVHRLAALPRLADSRHALLGGDVDEVDANLRVLGHPDDLAERHVFGDVAMNEVQVVALVPALALQLFLHVGHHVVVLGVDGHDAAVLRHLAEDRLQVAVGHTPAERGEYLEAGLTRLDRLADLADGLRTHRAREDVVVGEVYVAVAVERLPPRLHLPHDRVRRHGIVRRDRQRASEVEQRRDPAEGRGASGSLRGLREYLRPTCPLLRHRNADVRVRLDASGKHDQSRGVDDARAFGRERARMRQRGDPAARDGDVYFSHSLRSHNLPASNDRVQHDDPPPK